ncbi:MAG: PAS domain S-box protein [Cyanobacteria bacterium CRU_2_1]|nr:PAS domain S-box protein [Cyanobacteria bacterium RU_5_0]NJR62847.1 PAS domain S-box protein [Cyanobacteria bacterium CRU_2_1]
MNSLFTTLLALRQIEYITLDRDFRIVTISEGASQYADALYPLEVGGDCVLCFPELIGFEENLKALLEGRQMSFELQAITRPLPDDSLCYFDLCAAKLDSEEWLKGCLILFFINVTEQMRLEQSLVQASNEMSLLLSAINTSKDYVDTIITSMADALLVTTASGMIKTVNDATEALLGYSQAELIDQPFSMLVADQNFLIQAIQPKIRSQTEILRDIEVICRTKTGEKVSVAFSCAKIQTNVDRAPDFIYIGRDITERERTQQRLMAQYTAAHILSDAPSLSVAVAKILPALCHSLEWDLVELWLPTENQPSSPSLSSAFTPHSSSFYLWCAGSWSRSPQRTSAFMTITKQMTFAPGEGLPGRVWATRVPQWMPDVLEDARFVRSALAAQAGLHAAFGFPIQNNREMLGVVTFFSRKVRQPDPDLLHTMTVIGSQLGQFIQRKRAEVALRQEQERTESLLRNILPEPIADRLKQGEGTIAEHFADTTVLFADLADFTTIAVRFSPIQLVDLLNQIFSAFDRITEQYGLEKIKTIGDAYMVVGGVPKRRTDHAQAIADMALDMQAEIDRFNITHHQSFKMRIGIHSGAVVAGVIGIKKFSYDLWGDTVNTASRMESHGIAGQIQVSAQTYELLREQYEFKERGVVFIKGKGEMTTYLLSGRK